MMSISFPGKMLVILSDDFTNLFDTKVGLCSQELNVGKHSGEHLLKQKGYEKAINEGDAVDTFKEHFSVLSAGLGRPHYSNW